MEYKLTLIKGDGIGPEVTGATLKVLEAVGVRVRWEEVPAGAEGIAKYGKTVPDELLASIIRNKVALKGPLGTPIGRGFKSANVTLRKKLNLYSCLRPVKNIPGLQAPYGGVDLVVIRENTEGLYSGIEHEVSPGVVTTLKIMTAEACRRIAEWSFQYCRNNGRHRIVAAHKASVMKMSDELFLRCTRDVARRFPFIEYEEMPIDDVALGLTADPTRFDVLLLENMFGDIISDLTAGLVGGLGVVPGANIGDEYAVFEATHGSAPDIAGKGLANPTAMLLSAVLMLRYIGEHRAADRIQTAVETVLEAGKVRTRDLGGTSGTEEYTQALIEAL
jgi:isocitrate dehydrogenase (NAD+)